MLIQSAMNGTAAEVSTQVRLLGHAGCGVTELRVFEPQPMVAYADSERAAVDLVRQVQERAPGIYLGVQPRPCHLFDRAPNCWKPATAGHKTNCACDRDIEYITACFFDIDVLSEAREQGQPASNQELEWTRPDTELRGRSSRSSNGLLQRQRTLRAGPHSPYLRLLRRRSPEVCVLLPTVGRACVCLGSRSQARSGL